MAWAWPFTTFPLRQTTPPQPRKLLIGRKGDRYRIFLSFLPTLHLMVPMDFFSGRQLAVWQKLAILEGNQAENVRSQSCYIIVLFNFPSKVVWQKISKPISSRKRIVEIQMLSVQKKQHYWLSEKKYWFKLQYKKRICFSQVNHVWNFNVYVLLTFRRN